MKARTITNHEIDSTIKALNLYARWVELWAVGDADHKPNLDFLYTQYYRGLFKHSTGRKD